MLHEGPLPDSPPSEGRPHVALLGRFAERETALGALALAREALGLAASAAPPERARGCDFALASLIPDKDRRRRKRGRAPALVRPPRG
jgi:hypothetical protein